MSSTGTWATSVGSPQVTRHDRGPAIPSPLASDGCATVTRVSGRGRHPGRGDGGAAQHGVAVVEDGGLPGRDAAGGLVQADPERAAVGTSVARVDLAVRAQ